MTEKNIIQDIRDVVNKHSKAIKQLVEKIDKKNEEIEDLKTQVRFLRNQIMDLSKSSQGSHKDVFNDIFGGFMK